MKFINRTTERIKFPLKGNCPDWITVRPGAEVELEDVERAIAHGLAEVKEEVKAVESSIGKTKVETKIRLKGKAKNIPKGMTKEEAGKSKETFLEDAE